MSTKSLPQHNALSLKQLTALILLLFTNAFCFSQTDKTNQLKPLSVKEQQELLSLEELKLPANYRGRELPHEVDNTTKPWYSGLFLQSGLSCGQAALVANCFTYEINRLRDLNGSQTANKYPTHFAWNWENGGDGYHGVSYYHTITLLKQVGSPDMETYGGSHDSGGDSRFMSGYDAYYTAMQNRIEQAYAINCSTEEGILTLKHWINDHLDGSESGGFGAFYSQCATPSTTLPAGTEHAGEKVHTAWGSSPNHAMTITGYNDSIRYDYNNDGLYTNDIDLNADGIIDVRDWEIGGFKMCNTYSTIYNGWMMYRTLALASNAGGIWNNTVNVLKAVRDYSPLLTAKVNVNHSRRECVKFLIGVSTDTNGEEPEYYMTFPIFDYQGASYGLQNYNEPNAEIGYDITPLLNIYPSGTPLKFFFIVHEYDPDNYGSGMINSFSIIDYTSGTPVEHVSPNTNVPIQQNGVSMASVVHTPVFTSPQITTESLPDAHIYSNYSHQMEASSGTPPYKWSLDTDYSIEETNIALPIATTTLTGSYVELPFDFPFYDKTYDHFYLTNNGLIDFSGETYTLPYNDNNELSTYQVRFMNRQCIAAYYAHHTCNTYYISADDYFIIRWVRINDIDVSLKLESNGKITVFYNNCSSSNDLVWTSGISPGDVYNYVLTPLSGSSTSISDIGYTFTPTFASDLFSISETGLLTAYLSEQLQSYSLNFKIVDANGLIDRKTLPVSSDGIVITNTISTNNNDVIEWGETMNMNLSIRNATDAVVNDLTLRLSCDNPNITMNQDEYHAGTINVGETVNVDAAFLFTANYNFNNGEILGFSLTVDSEGDEPWTLYFSYPIYTAHINLKEFSVNDNDNGRLDIGETSDVCYTFNNIGNSGLDSIYLTISTDDWFLTINNNNNSFFSTLQPGDETEACFNFTASDDCIPGHSATLNFHIRAANGVEKDIETYITIGQILEDWETGSFVSYDWTHSGNNEWTICSDSPYEGNYCIKSGRIADDQSSTIAVEMEVLSVGEISFYRKISSESNYDFLIFYIDNLEMGRWDGELEWEKVAFQVQPGTHRFIWTYVKDYSQSSGDDCAWIDYIVFPSIYEADPVINVSKNEISRIMHPDVIETDTLQVSNIGGGMIRYNAKVIDDVPWVKEAPKTREIANAYMTCSSEGFYLGAPVALDFYATNVSTDNEWIRDIVMTFPEGLRVDSASLFIDNTNDTLFIIEGAPGYGGSWKWHGENADGWGVIKNNETAHCTIYGHIAGDFYGNLNVGYSLFGEGYGEEPHQVDDVITIRNLGNAITWLTLSNASGNVAIGHDTDIILNFSSKGLLNETTHNCLLEITTNIDTTVVIPVNLQIDDYQNVESIYSGQSVSIYPNPSSGSLQIKSSDMITNVKIINAKGQSVYNQSVNNHDCTLKLDVAKGIYFLLINTESGIKTSRIIIQ